eukprot:TRINITY_DN3301_c0_g1_i1.p1 TRINITY_DN3301_c0_g1~~TRINITY_DN3301_c0_g1_i1.p1  ORF type:complete len:633 (-),score=95.64 TRINITY_DN3301_c0_g1_i1:166-2064(-)
MSSIEIIVTVSSIDGRALDLLTDGANNVQTLKARIAEVWQIPALCQRLVSDETELQDEDFLRNYCHTNEDGLSVISVMLVIFDEEVHRCLQSRNFRLRKEAVEALGCLPLDQNEAILLIAARIEDRNDIVRKAAVGALAMVAEKGDERVIREVCARFGNEDGDVRKVAVQTLSEVTERGDPNAIDTVNSYLSHPYGRARVSAVQALGRLAPKASVSALEALLLCVGDNDARVQLAALKAIPLLGPVSCHGAVPTLRECLTGSDAQRRWAVKALTCLADAEDTETFDAVHKLINDPVVSVRSAVVEFLGKFAKRGDATFLKSMVDRIGDRTDLIRASAVRALSNFLESGEDEYLISALTRFLEHWDKSVQARAVEALCLPVFHGVEVAIQAVEELVRHEHDWIRLSAVRGLGHMYIQGCERGMKLFLSCLEDHSVEVIQEAVTSLGRVAICGDTQGINAVSSCLKHKDGWVRRSAAQTLEHVARQGDEQVKTILLHSLETDTDSEVVQAALKVLASVAPMDDDASIAAARACLSSQQDIQLRSIAIETMRKITQPEGSATVVAALGDCLSVICQDVDVIRLAVDTLAAFAERGSTAALQTLRNCRTGVGYGADAQSAAAASLRRIVVVTSCSG